MPTRIIVSSSKLDGKKSLRIASLDLLEKNKLKDLYIDCEYSSIGKASIHTGYVTQVEKSLSAVFVKYISGKDGFLPFKEIDIKYFRDGVRSSKNIKEGDRVMVQVVKTGKGSKGAYLTTFISIIGDFIILTTARNNLESKITFSSKFKSIPQNNKQAITEMISYSGVRDNQKVIVRTLASKDNIPLAKEEAIDFVTTWKQIHEEHQKVKGKSYKCILSQNRSIFEKINYDIADLHDIICNDEQLTRSIKRHINKVQKSEVNVIYHKSECLLKDCNLQDRIDSLFEKKITLDSGASIVIEHTEALTSIDVNSAKSTSFETSEETALNTNLDAAVEIALQIRSRRISGYIIIDFVGMSEIKSEEAVEKQFVNACSRDQAKISITKISRMGFMAISRQCIGEPLINHIGSDSVCEVNGSCGKSMQDIWQCIFSHIKTGIRSTQGKADIILDLSKKMFKAYKANYIVKIEGFMQQYNVSIKVHFALLNHLTVLPLS